ncbi:MAG: hypothetical protein AVDCRST_MAG68-2932, partial [uncultured Gemmatimonadetes bacterium]
EPTHRTDAARTRPGPAAARGAAGAALAAGGGLPHRGAPRRGERRAPRARAAPLHQPLAPPAGHPLPPPAPQRLPPQQRLGPARGRVRRDALPEPGAARARLRALHRRADRRPPRAPRVPAVAGLHRRGPPPAGRAAHWRVRDGVDGLGRAPLHPAAPAGSQGAALRLRAVVPARRRLRPYRLGHAAPPPPGRVLRRVRALRRDAGPGRRPGGGRHGRGRGREPRVRDARGGAARLRAHGRAPGPAAGHGRGDRAQASALRGRRRPPLRVGRGSALPARGGHPLLAQRRGPAQRAPRHPRPLPPRRHLVGGQPRRPAHAGRHPVGGLADRAVSVSAAHQPAPAGERRHRVSHAGDERLGQRGADRARGHAPVAARHPGQQRVARGVAGRGLHLLRQHLVRGRKAAPERKRAGGGHALVRRHALAGAAGAGGYGAGALAPRGGVPFAAHLQRHDLHQGVRGAAHAARLPGRAHLPPRPAPLLRPVSLPPRDGPRLLRRGRTGQRARPGRVLRAVDREHGQAGLLDSLRPHRPCGGWPLAHAGGAGAHGRRLDARHRARGRRGAARHGPRPPPDGGHHLSRAPRRGRRRPQLGDRRSRPGQQPRARPL